MFFIDNFFEIRQL